MVRLEEEVHGRMMGNEIVLQKRAGQSQGKTVGRIFLRQQNSINDTVERLEKNME